jgi:hypothetical protein
MTRRERGANTAATAARTVGRSRVASPPSRANGLAESGVAFSRTLERTFAA